MQFTPAWGRLLICDPRIIIREDAIHPRMGTATGEIAVIWANPFDAIHPRMGTATPGLSF